MTLSFESVDDFFDTDEFAESITYTAKGGAGTTITAIVDMSDDFQEPYDGSGSRFAHAEITVKRSEVTTPQTGDIFTGGNLGSYSWEINPERGVFHKDTNIFQIALRRQEDL